ncbi:MAG: TlpA family protein disulfide reductase [Desulfovibrio sp.]|nr:TlpA family protein disulfide reductase [Desulfovibrio sp.]
MKKFFLFFIVSALMPCAAFALPPAGLDLNSLADMLARNRGKVIAINFFATWCPPCRAEIPELSRAVREYAGKDVIFIGLSLDEEPDNVESFVKKMGINYPVYMAGRDITGAYRVSGIPHNAFYAKNGLLMISEPGILDRTTLKLVINKLLEH